MYNIEVLYDTQRYEIKLYNVCNLYNKKQNILYTLY